MTDSCGDPLSIRLFKVVWAVLSSLLVQGLAAQQTKVGVYELW